MITVAGKVRDIMGLDEELGISDEQLETIIKDAEQDVRRDLYTFNSMVEVNSWNNSSFDGTDTLFQTPAYPIADKDFDQTASDDVTGYWVDSSYDIQTCSITVDNALYGLINIYQDDGSSPIPSSNIEVKISYYSCDENIAFSDVEQLGTLLAAYYTQDRLVSPKKLSIADTETNRRKIENDNKRFLNRYKRKLRNFTEAELRST